MTAQAAGHSRSHFFLQDLPFYFVTCVKEIRFEICFGPTLLGTRTQDDENRS
jgi:hypothetical protein